MNTTPTINTAHTSMSMQIPSNYWLDFNIGIKHGFSCINVCQVPREVLETEADGREYTRGRHNRFRPADVAFFSSESDKNVAHNFLQNTVFQYTFQYTHMSSAGV